MSVFANRSNAWVWARAAALLLAGLAALAPAPARAQIANLRITEVDPWHGKVEITNYNGALFQLTSEIPSPYNFDLFNFKRMSIVPGWLFYSNKYYVFDYPDMRTDASDCWLYSSDDYENPAAIIHGVQFGTPPPERCNSNIAVLGGKWTRKSDSVPAPPPGCTLAWDGDGYSPLDWYVDSTPTMGAPNDTTPGSVNEPFSGPNASQGFEAPALGDQVTALQGWTMTGAGGRFSARFVGDVNGQAGSRPGSSSKHWLRIRDTDATGDNSFASPAIRLGSLPGYRLTFYINQESSPTMQGVPPLLAIQHATGTGTYADAWGIGFKRDGLEATVQGAGGTPASTRLCAWSGATGVGQWIKVELKVDLSGGSLLASVNGGTPVRLAIKPSGDPRNLRLAYQGSSAGNTQDMLLDDVVFAPWQNAAHAWQDYR